MAQLPLNTEVATETGVKWKAISKDHFSKKTKTGNSWNPCGPRGASRWRFPWPKPSGTAPLHLRADPEWGEAEPQLPALSFACHTFSQQRR